jgi:hypothetical protein
VVTADDAEEQRSDELGDGIADIGPGREVAAADSPFDHRPGAVAEEIGRG